MLGIILGAGSWKGSDVSLGEMITVRTEDLELQGLERKALRRDSSDNLTSHIKIFYGCFGLACLNAQLDRPLLVMV